MVFSNPICQTDDNPGSLDLALALSLIKQRNPRLWHKLASQGFFQETAGASELFPAERHVVKGSAANKADTGIESIGESFLYKFTTNNISSHIERATAFLGCNRHTWKCLSSQISTLESFGCGLEESDIAKWVLPNYRLLKWLYAKDPPQLQKRDRALRTVNSFQLLLISHYAFSGERNKVVHVLCQSLIYRFIKDELISFGPSKVRVLKLLRDYTDSNVVQVADVSLFSLSEGHLKLVKLILNIRISFQDHEVLSKTLQFLLKLLESLVVCLIKLNSSRYSPARKPRAYEIMYKARSKLMNYQYVTKVLEACHLLSRKEATIRLKISFTFVLKLVTSVEWLNAFDNSGAGQNELMRTLREHRTYIISSLLVLNDSRLISKFLKTRWPAQ
ncbi:Mei4p [Lachancea thermotolerans CBS 6340]|uniref:KLTH0A03564p n=1 Tax=Lachancea thermotolerans (strain ATCC 56472 / CBS 6340 / NRRL Y-8284) TaxID=559295 RepID=C5DBL4_LACTC|nr:KLTH0A03564p [Lachancea thermotolerans CBS 6340]CAR21171.1 KLTH0A03564p [Lachancea thermotolerans CBS 6340]